MKTCLRNALWLALAVSLVFGVAAKAQDVVPPTKQSDVDEAKAKAYLQKLIEQGDIDSKYKADVAKYYLDSARKRFAERRYEEAERDLQQALTANPNLEEAKKLLTQVRGMLGKTETGGDDYIKGMDERRTVELGFALREMRNTVSEAKQLMKDQKFDPALERLDQARNAAKVLALRVDVSRETAEINGLIDRASEARDKAKKEVEQKKLEEAKAMADADQARVSDLQKQRIERLFGDAKELYKDMRYLDAARKAQEILKIDPRNTEVAAFLEDCNKVQASEDMSVYTKTMVVETAGTWRDTRRLAIPFTQVQPVYPADWAEKRLRTAETEVTEETPEEVEFKKKMAGVMEQPISFDFIATPLDDVVAFLRGITRASIVVDKQAVAGRGGLDVTLKLDKMPFKDALEWILRLLDLRYTLENGAIFISTKEKIAANTRKVTRFYDVTDLTLEIRDFKPDLRAISSSDMGDIQQNQGVQDIFGEQNNPQDAKKEVFTGESLVEFIKSVIAPGTWEDLGVPAAKGL